MTAQRPRVQFTHFLLLLGLAFMAAVVGHLAVRGTEQHPIPPDWPVPPGDPERGRQALMAYGCISCHTVPGIRAANGRVGPQLAGIGEQTYIAGVLPNSPHNLVNWIRNPQEVDPLTAMPDLGVTEADAWDMVAYLYGTPSRR